MYNVLIYLISRAIIFRFVTAKVPVEFSHHVNNKWEKLHKNGENSALERMFLHHGRVIGDVILDTRKFLGEFHHQNDTNNIMSCELEIA